VSATTMAGARRATPRRAAPARPPRRISGPVAGRVRIQATPRQSITIGARALAVVRSLPDHSLIDGLVRGRAWIPVLGVLLAGIVAMQVEILKLGTSLGRSIERSTVLQGQNESLQASVAALADDQRIERLAAGMGMAMPSPSLVTFVQAHPQALFGRALGSIHAPDPTGFAAQLAAQVATDALIAPPTTSATPTGNQATTVASGPAASGSTGSAGTGTSGTANSTGAGPTPAGANGTATTTAGNSGAGGIGTAPATVASPVAGAGGGASSGAAGLPSTSTSQSGNFPGG
jgi:cell division protein FtsL